MEIAPLRRRRCISALIRRAVHSKRSSHLAAGCAVPEFLLLTLYAPLSSWGGIAVGEERNSWDRPSRSAVLGLVAAALGVARDDQASHDALDWGYGVAVRLDVAGSSVVDYHTAQSVAQASVKKWNPSTRAELLASGDHETILSRREYRQDALATVAIWRKQAAHWALTELAGAIRRPVFVLYAGRKANPFGLPLEPAVVTAETLADAFSLRADPAKCLEESRLRFRRGGRVEVAHDTCDGFASGLLPIRRETRRDVSAHRTRWQFAERTVEISATDVQPADSGLAVR